MEDAEAATGEVSVQTTGTLSLTPGLVYGVMAGLGTYVVVVVFLWVHAATLAGTTVAGVGARTFVFGTLGDFFGAHLGATDGVVLGVVGMGTIPAPVYYLVPPLSLFVCGRLCARSAGETEEAFLQGATVTLGYLLVVATLLAALFGLVEFELVGLSPVRVLLIAGFVYPVVFGGLGGHTTRYR